METVCVTMPDTLHEFLIALAVCQDLQLQMSVGAVKQCRENYQITFRMHEKFQFLEPAIRVVKDNIPIYDYSGWDEEQRGDFDCFIRFDKDMFERGKTIAKTIGQNIIYGMNHLVGSGAQPYPVLKALQLKQFEEYVSDILIISWDDVESYKLYEYISNNYPQLTSLGDERDLNLYKPEELLRYINHFRCVIGPHSIGTYIAGSLKKIVLDIFTSQEDGKLYGAPGTPKYLAVIGSNPSAKYLWHVFEQNIVPEVLKCHEITSETKSRKELDSTALHPVTVSSVEEKSGDKPILKSEP